jgi:hypothetical protein
MDELEPLQNPSTGSRARGAFSPEAIARAGVEREAIRLRLDQHTFQQIADELGLPNKGIAHRYVERGLSRWMRDADEALRHQELERTDAIVDKLWPLVMADPPDLAVLDRLMRVLDYRAKITGLYAPKRQQVQVEVDIDPDAVTHKLEAAKVIDDRAAEFFPMLESTGA